MSSVPDIRLSVCNEAPVRADGDLVLYWMIAFRRTTWNFSLQRAVEWAKTLAKPLLVFEPLRIGYPWASDRLHRFVLDGMADTARRLEPLRERGVFYYPYVEPTPDADKGLLVALAKRACVIVTDEYPCSFLPRMVRSAAERVSVRLEQVDSNGLLPLRASEKCFSTAHTFRRHLQNNLRVHLGDFPEPDPLAHVRLPPLRALPSEIARRWPPTSKALLLGKSEALAELAIDHAVRPVAYAGGATAARASLGEFLLTGWIAMPSWRTIPMKTPAADCRHTYISDISPLMRCFTASLSGKTGIQTSWQPRPPASAKVGGE